MYQPLVVVVPVFARFRFQGGCPHSFPFDFPTQYDEEEFLGDKCCSKIPCCPYYTMYLSRMVFEILSRIDGFSVGKL